MSTCPLGLPGECDWRGGYPEGYTDPPWSSEKDFAERVLPARQEAIARAFTEHLHSHGYEDMQVEWAPKK